MTNKSVIQIKSKEQLEDLIFKNESLILYFSLQGCNVCDDVFPMLMDILNDQPIQVAKIDINEQKEISGQQLVFTVPTIMIMHEGREILRESRFIDFNNIKRILGLIK